MRQFVLPEDWDGSSPFRVVGKRARYLSGVLRLQAGDRFPGVDASGRAWDLAVIEIGSGGILLAAKEAERDGSRLPDVRTGSATAAPSADPGIGRLPRIVLAQALAKGPAMDRIVRQATEAGVALILPLLAERSVPDPDKGRLERWRRISREALQQSGSAIPTAVGGIRHLAELAEALGPAPGARRGIFCHEAPLASDSFHRYLGHRIDELVICVGPEGGFSEREAAFFESIGFGPVSLGPNILRAETAAVFALAAAEIVILERESWTASE
ncbi:MAG: 16S rRNA (uracil(1498)-N(3))-methyltransferase [Spirochaetales bacterium]|nr:16S rRNA (uracil(1498)-N(3))-methyltransferase [Spirochaetales bacterium]